MGAGPAEFEPTNLESPFFSCVRLGVNSSLAMRRMGFECFGYV